MDDGFRRRDDEAVLGVRATRVSGWRPGEAADDRRPWRRRIKDGVMSDDRDHTIATATATSEETPYGVRINTGGHALRGDEPVGHGGADTGPTPFGLLLSGLGACTAITLRMYAERQSWPLAGVDVELTYVVKDRDTRWIDRVITLHGVDEDQSAKLAEIAEKTPVTRAVRAGTDIRTTTGTA
jgi:putative redox protein